jgi:hypothetical protein
MIAIPKEEPRRDPMPAWHAAFLAMVPTIRKVALHAFRHTRPEQREDLVEEVIANCLVAFTRLAEQGKTHLAFATVLAGYAVAQVRCGRRVGGQLNSQDVLSGYAQRKNGFTIERLDRQSKTTGFWAEAVVEDYRTPVPDQASFRVDFPEWLSAQNHRDRQVAEALAIGERTKDVARQFQISPGRISQIRRELHDSWQEFHGEPA